MARIAGNLIGARAVLQRLDRLPQKVRNKVIRPAINKQATVVAKAARRLIPKGDEPPTTIDGGTRKHLKATIGTRTKTYGTNITAVIGPKSREAPHSHLVHGGTRAHAVTIRDRINRNIITGSWQHPGARANPFLMKALEQTRAEQLAVFTAAVRSNIERVAATA